MALRSVGYVRQWFRQPPRPLPAVSAARLVLVVAAALTASCTGERSSADRVLPWRVDLRWTVGGADNSQISLSRVEAFQVASDGVDAIYVLDRLSHRVFVLDSNGLVRDTLGRQGAGPGELAAPWAVAVDRQGTVAVLDLGNRRVVRWSARGELLEALPIRDFVESPKFAIQGGDVAFVLADHSRDGPGEYQLVLTGANGTRVRARLARPPLHLGDLPTCDATSISLTPIFMPAIHWDAAGDRLAVNAGADYAVELYRSGVLSSTARRAIGPARADQASAETEATDWRFNDCLVPPAEVVRASGYRDVIPVVQSLALSPDGDLWVLRRTLRRDAPAVDLFDTAGSYRGTLTTGGLFPSAFLGADRIVTVEKDSNDVPSVSLYRIDRSRSPQSSTGDQPGGS